MRYLHTMIRVTDLAKSLRFYCEGLGFEMVSRQDYPKDRFTLVFLRAPGDKTLSAEKSPMLELTHNWDTSAYTRGDAYGHMAYAVESIDDVRSKLKRISCDLSWGPGPTPSGKITMAFIDDPDGYEIELLEHKSSGK